MNCCICFLKKLASTESSLATAEALVNDRVSAAELAVDTTKGARQGAEELESDSKAVSIEELDGTLSAYSLHCTEYAGTYRQLMQMNSLLALQQTS